MRLFDQQLLRLKEALGVTADQDVAAALGMTKAALSERKRRDAFPKEKLYELVARRPELEIDTVYVLTGEHQELNRRLKALKEASDLAAELKLPAREQMLARDIYFGTRMRNSEQVRETIELYVAERMPAVEKKRSRSAQPK